MYVGSDSGAYSQWLYRVTLDIEDGESLVSELFVSRSDFNHTFDRAFTRLCYTLTAERWDGTEVSTVRTECIANPITYGEREITPDAWTSKYWSCDAPPDGHMDMWCRTHERCAMREPDDLYDLSCQDAIAICGWASSNDSGTSAEDAGPEVAAPDGSAANASAGSMCHAAPWRAQRSLEAWLAMGLLAWTSSRRRRLGATSRQASRCRSCS